MIKFKKKLQNKFNVYDLMLKCVKGYIKDITERLVIKSEHSKILPVNSGVPQGSTLEPFFFALLMINNMTIFPRGTILLYMQIITKSGEK